MHLMSHAGVAADMQTVLMHLYKGDKTARCNIGRKHVAQVVVRPVQERTAINMMRYHALNAQHSPTQVSCGTNMQVRAASTDRLGHGSHRTALQRAQGVDKARSLVANHEQLKRRAMSRVHSPRQQRPSHVAHHLVFTKRTPWTANHSRCCRCCCCPLGLGYALQHCTEM
jgi:hypothetical protein